MVWSHDCQAAFDSLRHSLCSSPVLRNPDFSRSFIVQTDASETAAGAVLAQLDEHDHEHPIAYFSRKFLPREERYSTVEKECLAIKLALQAFKVYLLGRPFLVQTDHRALQWLSMHKDQYQWLSMHKDTNPRLTRWTASLRFLHRASPWSTQHKCRRALPLIFFSLQYPCVHVFCFLLSSTHFFLSFFNELVRCRRRRGGCEKALCHLLTIY